MGEAERTAAAPVLRWAGDGAIVIEYGEVISSELARRAQRVAAALEAAGLPWLVEAVPTYRSTLAVIRPEEVWPAEAMQAVERIVAAAESEGDANVERRVVEVPVYYGGEYGPDLGDVAAHAGFRLKGHCHTSRPYGADDRLHAGLSLPCRDGPAHRHAAPDHPAHAIPAGSVGIAGNQTVYPLASPGGWRIIGRTPLRLADPSSDPPCLLRAGDMVKFVPTEPPQESKTPPEEV